MIHAQPSTVTFVGNSIYFYIAYRGDSIWYQLEFHNEFFIFEASMSSNKESILINLGTRWNWTTGVFVLEW